MREIKFITWKEADGKPENDLGCSGGWFNAGMRWKDYKDAWKDEYHERLEELRTAIINNNIEFTGEEHQYGCKAVPLFPDGSVATYTFRAWGDLMAAIWSTVRDEDYSYMTYYM